mgnify:CR=1 FL=1
MFKCWTSNPCILPLDTFYIAKYPKIVQFSSVIPFWKAIKLLIPEFFPFCNILTEGHFTDHWKKGAIFFYHPWATDDNTQYSKTWDIFLWVSFISFVVIGTYQLYSKILGWWLEYERKQNYSSNKPFTVKYLCFHSASFFIYLTKFNGLKTFIPKRWK